MVYANYFIVIISILVLATGLRLKDLRIAISIENIDVFFASRNSIDI